MENKFITDVVGMIKNKSAKKLIQAELESHILDKSDYYKEIGYSEEEAIQKATEEMGDAEETAFPLNNLHNRKWYKNPANYLTVFLMPFTTAVFAIMYLYFSYDFNHYITIDFLSLGIYAVYMLLLFYARQNNNKFVACVVFLQMAYITVNILHPQYMFYPAMYTLASIVTQGFSGYTDSIFSYNNIPEYMSPIIIIGSVILVLSILIYAVIVIITIHKKQRMSCKIKNKPFRIFERCVSVFIAVNIAAMSICTAFALGSLNERAENLQRVNKDMIECTIDIYRNRDTIDDEKLREILSETGYEFSEEALNYSFEEDTTRYVTRQDYARYEFEYCEDERVTVDCTMDCNSSVDDIRLYTLYDFNNFISDDVFITYDTVYNPYKDKEKVNDIEDCLTLDEFLSYGIYDKACRVVIPNQKEKELWFVFQTNPLEFNTGKYCYLQFQGESLTSMAIVDKDYILI